MAAIITDKFRIHNAESYIEGFSESAATNIYLFIGRPQPWTNDTSPDTPLKAHSCVAKSFRVVPISAQGLCPAELTMFDMLGGK